MINATPILCPHGKKVSWTGTAKPGERLPEIEYCEKCYPNAIRLKGTS